MTLSRSNRMDGTISGHLVRFEAVRDLSPHSPRLLFSNLVMHARYVK